MSLSKKVTPGLTEWQTLSWTSLRFYVSSVYHHNATFFFRLVTIQMIWSWKGDLDLKRLWIWLQSSFHLWCYQFLGIQCFKWNWSLKKDFVYVFNCICVVISQVNLNLHPQPTFSDIHFFFFFCELSDILQGKASSVFVSVCRMQLDKQQLNVCSVILLWWNVR